MSVPENPVAIVSGGAQGIGAAIARRLASDGFHAVIVDIDEKSAEGLASDIRAGGGRALAVRADITSVADVTALQDIVGEVGTPAVLVNNAGITRDNLLFKMSESDWDSVIAVHLRGAFLLSKTLHSAMREAGWGRIITISSTSADGNRGQANYSTAKAGLIGFTKTLAKELGRFGITANAVAPGFIDTRMLRSTAERLGVSFDEYTSASVERIPLQRFGMPDDVANAVSFLASEQAGYITGELIHVSGGFHE